MEKLDLISSVKAVSLEYWTVSKYLINRKGDGVSSLSNFRWEEEDKH